MSWINETLGIIDEMLDAKLPPAKDIPTPLLLCDLLNRPGMSAARLAAAIISRLPEAGIPTEKLPDGSENIVNQFVLILCEELINEIHRNGIVQVGIETNNITTVGSGGNAGGPVEIIATNQTPAKGLGALK